MVANANLAERSRSPENGCRCKPWVAPALTRHPPAMPIDCDPKQRWSSVLRACLLITVVPLAVRSQGGGYRRPSWTPCCPPHSTLSLSYCLPPPAPATSRGGRWPTCATFESFGLCHDYGHSKEVELVAKGVCRHTCHACPWPGNAAVYDVARSIGAEIRLPYKTGHEAALAAAPTCEMLDDPSRAAECLELRRCRTETLPAADDYRTPIDDHATVTHILATCYKNRGSNASAACCAGSPYPGVGAGPPKPLDRPPPHPPPPPPPFPLNFVGRDGRERRNGVWYGADGKRELSALDET